MEAEIKKILGIILIVVGLGIFWWDIATSYYYFTAQQEFPQVFVQSAIESTTSQPIAGGTTIQDQMNSIIEEQINQQIKNLLPANSITEILNMTAWIAFATLLIYAATKIIGIGRDFLKDAREDKKSEAQTTNPPL